MAYLNRLHRQDNSVLARLITCSAEDSALLHDLVCFVDSTESDLQRQLDLLLMNILLWRRTTLISSDNHKNVQASLYYACKVAHVRIAQWLHTYCGGQLYERTASGDWPFFSLVRYNDSTLVHNTLVRLKDDYKQSAHGHQAVQVLLYAIKKHNQDMVCILIHHHSIGTLYQLDIHGESAMSQAMWFGCYGMLEWMMLKWTDAAYALHQYCMVNPSTALRFPELLAAACIQSKLLLSLSTVCTNTAVTDRDPRLLVPFAILSLVHGSVCYTGVIPRQLQTKRNNLVAQASSMARTQALDVYTYAMLSLNRHLILEVSELVLAYVPSPSPLQCLRQCFCTAAEVSGYDYLGEPDVVTRMYLRRGCPSLLQPVRDPPMYVVCQTNTTY
jgi:hypothetical protein